MNTHRTLAFVMVLQTLILLGQWVGVPSPSATQAQVPDGGRQRADTIEELRSVNTKLDKLITVLTDGKLKVSVVASDEK